MTACIDCETPGTPGDNLSLRGLCIECGIRRTLKASQQMQSKSGPYYEQWRRSMAEVGRRAAASS